MQLSHVAFLDVGRTTTANTDDTVFDDAGSATYLGKNVRGR